jgi:hypothetical protein
MQRAFWLSLVAGMSLVLAVALAISSQNLDPYAYISGDTRVFVFWMDMWRDHSTFATDPLAAFFKDRSPISYQLIFWLAFQAGIAPKDAAAALPVLIVPLLFLGTYLLAYDVSKRASIAAVCAVAFTLFCYPLTATPREFAGPIIVWCLVFLNRRSLVGLPLAIGLGALLYPIGALIGCATVGTLLLRWNAGRITLDLRGRTLLLIGLTAAAALIAILVQAGQHHGGTISYQEALNSPIFAAGGRLQFFLPDFTSFYVCSHRSGFLGSEACRSVFVGAVMVVGLAVLAFLAVRGDRTGLRQDLEPLIRVAVASCALYVLAHLFLFHLYLPSRYTMWTLPLVSILSLGAAASAIVDAEGSFKRRPLAVAAVFAVLLAVMGTLLWLRWGSRVLAGSVTPLSQHTEIVDAVAKLPPDQSVASLDYAVSDLPLLTKHRIVTGQEEFFGYNRAFRDLMLERTSDTADAIYQDGPEELLAYLDKYQVGAFTIGNNAWEERALERGWWTNNLPEKTQEIVEFRSRGGRSALERNYEPCIEARSAKMLYIDAACLKRSLR